MKVIDQFLAELDALDIKLWVEGERLRYNAPKGALTGSLRAQLIRRKAEIISVLQKATLAADSLVVVPDPDARYEPFPLTDIQQAYWIGRRPGLEFGNVAMHTYVEIKCQALNLERLNEAWNKLLLRHEMLRAIVLPTGHQQILAQVPPYQIQVTDLRGLTAEARLAHLEAERERMSHQIFDLSQWPLFEIRVSLLSSEEARLQMSLDTTLIDAMSAQLLFKELLEAYQNPMALQEALEISFRDYVLTTLKIQESPLYQNSLQHWRTRLLTLPLAPELPKAAGSASSQPHFERWEAQLDAQSWQRLKKRALAANLTPPALLLAAYAEVLAAWSNSPRFTINVPLFNRLALHPQINELLGTLSSFTLVEADYGTDTTFLARARSIQDQLRSGLEHSHVSGVRILRELYQSRGNISAGTMPIVFTSVPNLASQYRDTIAKDLQWEPVTVLTQTPQVWIDNQVFYGENGLNFNWDGVPELFPPGMIDEMFKAYHRLLKELADSDLPWQQTTLQLVPQAQLLERAQLNATSAPIPQGTLESHFAAQAKERPHQAAVITSQRTLTYADIEASANQLAHRLRQQGVGPNQLVPIVMEKGWQQIVAVFAVLKAGAAYTPIDGHFPQDRINLLIEDSAAQVVLTQSWLKETITWANGVEVISLSDDVPDETYSSSAPLTRPACVASKQSSQPNDLAYVLYTSGSTGKPKGVMIEHRSVINRMTDVAERFGLHSSDRAIALTALHHDLSIFDIFCMLSIVGGSIVLPDAKGVRDPSHWVKIMQEHEVTLWNSVPAYMQMMVEYLENTPNLTPSQLRWVILSGDFIPVSLPDRLRGLLPQVEIISAGGPTETTVWDICYPIGEVDPGWKSIPYGKPMRNAQYHVLNDKLDARPVWVPGELYISGVGLARGYWRDEARTQESFITPPREAPSPQRLYRSGDLGRYLPDGNIEILGRKDFQVKIRGQRIELGEIEAILTRHRRVERAVVTVFGEKQKRLVAYVVSPEALEQKEEAAAHKAADYDAFGEVIESEAQRLEFKLKQLGLRAEKPNTRKRRLPKPEVDDSLREAYLARQSYREFVTAPIPLQSFGHWLSCLLQEKIEGSPFPKYRYPSGGGLYPVQTYLYIKPNRVEGLAGGFYYYHPASHDLILTGAEMPVSSLYQGINQPIFDASAFSLFLVGQMEAITPMYGTLARDFSLLEAGYMGQLLMQEAPENQLGLCPIGGLGFDTLRDSFDLHESHILLHSFVGGQIEPTQPKQWLQPTSASAPVAPSVSIERELRNHLAEKLPSHMLPAAYVFLDTLPLTANGKVNRKALPAPDEVDEARKEGVAPRTPLEQEIADVMQEMLGTTIGIHDNFFEFGGDSVIAIQLLSRLQNRFSVEYPLGEFFDRPTIENLGEYIETVRWASGEGSDSFSADNLAGCASQIEEEVEF